LLGGGGHILLLGIESIRRKPLTMRQMERVQGVGLVLVLGLMGFVLFNDLSRLSSF
jgi:regulator of sigma E protease